MRAAPDDPTASAHDPPPDAALAAIVDALPVAALLFDRCDDRIVACNDAARERIGIAPASAVPARVADLEAGPDSDGHARRRAALRPGQPVLRYATVLRAHDGRARPTDVVVRAVDLGGSLLGVVVWRDAGDAADALQRLREREAELARVQRIGRLGGFEIDLAGPAFVNRRSPEYLRLYGLPPEAEGEPHAAWVGRLHPEDREPVERRFFAAVHGTDVDYANEYRVIAADGDVRWIRALAEIERDAAGRALRMVGAHLDVTDLKRAQAESAEQARRLEAMDRRKDEFLAVLSHELRNPLAALTNALALLRRPRPPDGTPAAMLEIAQRQVRQLTRLVEDLLEVSRISAGKIVLRPEPMRVGDVVRDALIGAGGSLSARDQSLSLAVTDPALGVLADRARLVQVVENLVGNASKFSEPGGAIRVTVAAEGDEAVIAVEDDGAGIPADALDDLFELFVQVDAQRDGAQGGLGIGLALVRRLVELHGGRVGVHSDGPGRGARFTVRLPRHFAV